jgi:hypothetical protein
MARQWRGAGAERGRGTNRELRHRLMNRRRIDWSSVQVPRSVGQWVRAMSARIGAPAHRIVRQLIDDYVERLPPGPRRQYERIVSRIREPERQ